MEKYFDAFVHVANWGTRWFMFRIPKQFLVQDVVAEYYLDDEYLAFTTEGENVIVSFRIDDDEPEWTDGEGWLSSLIPLRADLMRGDHRCLYLAWLCSIQASSLEDNVLEPPVPAGLGNLSARLERLADFLCIDFDLIAAAAEQSEVAEHQELSKEEIAHWVSNLPLEDKNSALVRLIEDDAPHRAAEIRRHCVREIGAKRQADGGFQSISRRSAGQILARAEAIAEDRRRIKAERAARDKAKREIEEAENRRKHLESLKGKETDLWTKVDQLINAKQPKRYDQALSMLQDLRELADNNGTSSAFWLRMEQLWSEHSGKRTLLDRLQRARLSIST